jgi:hypothetical protein
MFKIRRVSARSKKHGISKLIRRRLAPVAAALAVALAGAALGAPSAHAGIETTQLTLKSGWKDAPFSTNHAGVWQDNDGVVMFTGAISGGVPGVAFTLPANDRPSRYVSIPVDMCNAAKGQLTIAPTGDVTVQSEGSFSNASCFTSLDGASFQLWSASLLPLTLQNNWQAHGTAAPEVGYLNYYNPCCNVGPTPQSVRLSGAISGGANLTVAFTLPVGYRPSTTVYVPVDMCGAANGRLIITPDGNAVVQEESQASASANCSTPLPGVPCSKVSCPTQPCKATCLTSLDGAWFTLNPSPSYQTLTLGTGWDSGGYGTAAPAVELAGSLGETIQFSGAISTSSTNFNTLVFTLPPPYRPSTDVYIPVDMCGATKGRLYIQPSGMAFVEAENGTFSNAQCFTSLDGVSFTNWQVFTT